MTLDQIGWLEALRHAVRSGRIEWKQHALERLLAREIRIEEVEELFLNGEIIEFYPDAYPVPACLMLHVADQPLHVVVAFSEQSGICYPITLYRPSPDKFETDWKTRK